LASNDAGIHHLGGYLRNGLDVQFEDQDWPEPNGRERRHEARGSTRSILLLDLMGGVALPLWGLHMVRSGIMRAFGCELRRALSTALPCCQTPAAGIACGRFQTHNSYCGPRKLSGSSLEVNFGGDMATDVVRQAAERAQQQGRRETNLIRIKEVSAIECDLPVPRPQPRSRGGSCASRARNTQSSDRPASS
jgi:hypothetical protein